MYSENGKIWLDKIVLLLSLAALEIAGAQVAVQVASAAPNPQNGQEISGQCAACHGSNGISIAPSIPNLAGQHYEYLLEQLKAFKDGTRKNPLMKDFALPLSTQEMQDISAYFASIPIHVGHPKFRKPTAPQPAAHLQAANPKNPHHG